MSAFARHVICLVTLLVLPSTAYAQATISGTVRDTSGGVLPGVTVEATSPALIERVRTTVTDANGQYRIVDLRPGVYSVTFTLPGFTTVQREGIELQGSFNATIDVALPLGGLEETITVSGEAPVVDVQSVTRQQVIEQEVVAALPTGGTVQGLAVLVPGIVTSTGSGGIASQDVGGSMTGSAFDLAIHGGRTGDQRVMLNNVPISSPAMGGGRSQQVLNPAAAQEIVINTSANEAQMPTGGVMINFVPRDGSNVFSGSFLTNFSSKSLQGNNFTQELKDAGLRTPDAMRKLLDVSLGIGGPAKRDRVWFFVAARYNDAANYVSDMFYNLNANKPDVWTYEPDLSRPAYNRAETKDLQARFTTQLGQRLGRLSTHLGYQDLCTCTWQIRATRSPEAGVTRSFPGQKQVAFDWTAPVSLNFMLEGAYLWKKEDFKVAEAPGLNPQMIPVIEQSTGLEYRAAFNSYAKNVYRAQHSRVAASWITAAHMFKFGMTLSKGPAERYFYEVQPYRYRLNNGIPNQITISARPYLQANRIDHDLGLFAQDRWAFGRVTANLGLRLDIWQDSVPEQHLGPGYLLPDRNITFPARTNLQWRDLSPRMGLVYDVTGTGRTALRIGLNRYVEGMGLGDLAVMLNPVSNMVTTTTRSWNDANGDFVPDCDLTAPEANGECGAMANSNFGKTVPSTQFDPDFLSGWGKRGYNWEFNVGVQHELLPALAVDFAFYRRSFGNHTVIDNRAVNPDDYDPFSVTAPVDSRLPGGGGYTIGGLYDLKPEKFGVPADNWYTFARNYGKQIENRQGFDLNFNVREFAGVLLQGGMSVGRTLTDNCDIVTKLDNPSTLYCRVETPYQPNVKGLVTYLIPGIDVRLSGTFQSIPGPQLAANYNAPNALVMPSLGRPLAGGAANVTVNLVEPGTMYGERLNQIDLRFGKEFRFDERRISINVDLFNLMNSNAVLLENSNYAVWRRPEAILPARFLRLGVNVDF